MTGSLALGPGLSLSLYAILREYEKASFKVEGGILGRLNGQAGQSGDTSLDYKSRQARRRGEGAPQNSGVHSSGLQLGLFTTKGLGRVEVMATKLSDFAVAWSWSWRSYDGASINSPMTNEPA